MYACVFSAPVEYTVMFGYPSTADMPSELPDGSVTPSELQYQENQRGYFECRVRGGFPRPVIRLLIDDRQVC